MADLMYNAGKKWLMENDISSANLSAALVTSSYSPDKDNDTYFEDISNEITASGYTSGGKLLENINITQDNLNDIAIFDGDDIIWTNTQVNGVRGIIFYNNFDSPSPPTTALSSNLLAYYDFGTDQTNTVGANFSIEWSSSGILGVQ